MRLRRPLVGIIMGSRSDWETMRHAAETLERARRAVRGARRVGAPHAGPAVRVRRPRPRRAACEVIIAGAGGAAHLPGMAAAKTRAAGARRAGRVDGAERRRFAALDRADAGRRAGRRRWPSAGPARSTRRCSRPRILAREARRQSAQRLARVPRSDADRSDVLGAPRPAPDRSEPRDASASSAAASSAACWRSPGYPLGPALPLPRPGAERAAGAGRRPASSAPTTTADALGGSPPALDVVTYEFENVPGRRRRALLAERVAGLPAAGGARGRAGPARREELFARARHPDAAVRRRRLARGRSTRRSARSACRRS